MVIFEESLMGNLINSIWHRTDRILQNKLDNFRWELSNEIDYLWDILEINYKEKFLIK